MLFGKPKTKITWEHVTVTIPLDLTAYPGHDYVRNVCDGWGSQGWETVSVVPIANTNSVFAVFKRVKQ